MSTKLSTYQRKLQQEKEDLQYLESKKAAIEPNTVEHDNLMLSIRSKKRAIRTFETRIRERENGKTETK